MSEARERKAELRAQLLRARRELTTEQRAAAGPALAARVRGLPELAAVNTMAAYVSVGTEPPTRDLIEALRSAGTRVLLPVLLADNDLDWAEYGGPAALERTGRGLWEPVGERLGPQAVTDARAVLLPGLAVDARGTRLGRGGGSYDRVLGRLQETGADPLLLVLLYAHEVVADMPAEPHDRPVHLAVTPEGVHRFKGTG